MIVLLALVLAPFALAFAAATIIYTFSKLARWHRRRYRVHVLSEREVRSGIDPGEYGVDISIWPSRAPRNGSAYDHIE